MAFTSSNKMSSQPPITTPVMMNPYKRNIW